ncbi:MAG TPA: hypothetical protein VJ732_18510 [Bryobacteraceae bacterium]|nr:hypothetical protein [Bryobacteraceae bacterium]
METHIKVIGILHVVLGGMGVLAAAGLLLLFGGLAGMLGFSSRVPEDALAVPVLGAIGIVVFVVMILLWLPGVIGGIGLLRLAPWSRVFMIVISALDLLSIPFGTALGIYGLWALTQPETQDLFARRSVYPAAM